MPGSGFCRSSRNATPRRKRARTRPRGALGKRGTSEPERRVGDSKRRTPVNQRRTHHANQALLSANAALAEARDFASLIVETAAAPLLVLDSELRVITANPSFNRAFRISPGEAEGQLLYSISNGGWNIPRLREMLERILPDHKVVQDFEIEQDFPGIGRKVLALTARAAWRLSADPPGHRRYYRAQERARDALRESEERFRNMADTAPVMIWVSGPDKACTFFNKPLAGFYWPHAATGTGQRLDRKCASGGPGPLPGDLHILVRCAPQLPNGIPVEAGRWRIPVAAGQRCSAFRARRRLCRLHRFLRRYH